MTGPSDHRRVYADLAQQLVSGEPLGVEQRGFLAAAFKRLADGEDANAVFGLKLSRGQSNAGAEGRKTVSLLLHMVAAYVDDGMGVENACNQVAENAQHLPPNGSVYDADYIKKCWYKYGHMQSEERNLFDSDFPCDV